MGNFAECLTARSPLGDGALTPSTTTRAFVLLVAAVSERVLVIYSAMLVRADDAKVHHRRRYSMPQLRRPRRRPKPDRRRRPQGIPLFEIRLADASDSEAIFSILHEVACHVPVDLSTRNMSGH